VSLTYWPAQPNHARLRHLRHATLIPPPFSTSRPLSAAVGPAEFECLAVLMDHTQDVKSVAWHPSSELLASASYDDTIRLYAADPYDDEWATVQTLASHSATVWAVAFSPDGEYLASAGDDLVVKLWRRAAQGVELGEAGEARREEGGRMGPWSSAGVRIGQKERFRWEEVGQIEGAHERTIYSLDWKKGGDKEEGGGLGRIVTGGGDGTINVFQIVSQPKPRPSLSTPGPAVAHADPRTHPLSPLFADQAVRPARVPHPLARRLRPRRPRRLGCESRVVVHHLAQARRAQAARPPRRAVRGRRGGG